MKTLLPIGALVGALVAPALASAELTADEISKKTSHASYYQAKDGRARIKMTITDKQGRTRLREVTVLRKDGAEDDADQKFFLYFHAPADVARMTFIVHKHVDRDDDRWLYLPAMDLVKRIAASDKRTSFAGSDFLYEDVSGRALDADTHALVKTTDNFYVLEHTPKDPAEVEFSKYVMHVHKKTFLPTKVEYFDKAGKGYRTMTVDRVETIDGHPTVVQATIADAAAGTKTVAEYGQVDYDIEVPDRIFTERYLRRAPTRFLTK